MSAHAEETIYPRGSHTYVQTEDYASDEWNVDLRGTYLNGGTSVISREAVNRINISGATIAGRTCDQVRLILYVERSTSYATGYSTYKTYTFVEDDVYEVTKGISNIPVERGYYYRVYGVHSVTHNGVIETTDTLTDPLDYR
jgi:hypothetical protein